MNNVVIYDEGFLIPKSKCKYPRNNHRYIPTAWERTMFCKLRYLDGQSKRCLECGEINPKFALEVENE